MSTRPRIRSIKPEMGQDEKFGQLSRDGRLLFIGLISLADDEGRFLALPSVILGHWYPFDQDAPRKLRAWLDELVERAMVVLYEHAGVAYGWLPGWHHQKINRARPSTLPAPPSHVALTAPSLKDHGTFSETSVSNHGTFTEASRPRARGGDRTGSDQGSDRNGSTTGGPVEGSTTTPPAPHSFDVVGGRAA